ncbi:ATPase, T2SS/T4P/T4SS family [Lentisphaerota bacterium WC36G]|nr:Flp pilus assembly complex ATPase component TadA [Lentisphaerae bacterium WC36]
MLEIKIQQGQNEPITGKLVPGVYLAGSANDCHIPLEGGAVASHQVEIIYKDNALTIQDLNSGIETFVDKYRLEPNVVYEVSFGSEITFGDAIINVIGLESEDFNLDSNDKNEGKSSEELEKIRENEELLNEAANNANSSTLGSRFTQGNDDEEFPILQISGIPLDARPLVQKIKKQAHAELLKRLNLKKLAMTGISEEELADKARVTIHEILSELSIPLPDKVSLKIIEKELINEAIGLGPLEMLIELTDITEIMVNGPNNVYVEYQGKLYKTDSAFADDYQVLAAIERIVSPLGRRIDESSPMVDARLSDGSRVNAIIPPLSLVGPSITIRKFSADPLTSNDLIKFGSASHDIFEFLQACVKVRKNIIISGGTGSGKTTFLNILSSFLPNSERIVTIEDAAELQLRQDHVVRLESRPANIEGKGEISIRDLVKNSLRMRPDRIVVGECRGGEALDMLQAMNTGHDGSLTTVHANSPRDALSRLETLVLMAGFDLPLRAIREQITSAVTIIVQVNREKDGSRKVTKVSEITKMEGEIITLQDIFVFKHKGWDENNKIIGSHEPTGSVPSFMEELERANITLDINMFNPGAH